ncbi:MAG: cytochrome c-type biogenesis CcmF C-terminal domain-containing protein [Bacteroidota bacterium]
MLGSSIVRVAFAGVLFSTLAYFLSFSRRDEKWAVRARYGFYVGALGTFLAAALLMYFILTHQFQYTYVWSYSSTSLPIHFLISTFYAGQEGSFMLWALYTAIIGLLLMQYSARKGYEAEIMAVFGLIEVFLLLMLIIKNPFEYVWDSFPKEVEAGFVPANGRGLNPLLQNYWMVIHPPILFLGFASMSVPFAHAVAALIKRDYHNWIVPATPWTIFAVTALGTGITLGGFWAYETLGWGGYWGWDPVENSSLIPWLVCLASVHTMMSQRRSGSFVRTNFVLSLLVFVLVLYSTFLTRSGVLADTSVHSFVEPGMWAYVVLVAVIVVFTGLGFGLFLKRMKEMPKVRLEHTIISRELALFLGALALIVCSTFVIVGTSSPLITGLFGQKPSAVDTSYYNNTTLPIAVVLALLSGVGQLVWWKQSKKHSLQRNLLLPFVAAVVLTLVLILLGLRQAPIILLSFAAAFTLVANLSVAYTIIRGNPLLGGGSIAHVGLAFVLFGIIGSSYYSEKETVLLERGRPVESFGCTLKYVGYHPIDEERYAFLVEVEKSGRKFMLSPIMYYSDYSKGIMRNPDIANLWTRDFYLSPVSLDTPEGGDAKNVRLMKGKPEQIGETKVTFQGFDFSDEERGKMMEGKDFAIGANLLVEKDGKRSSVVAKMKNSNGKMTYEPASAGGMKFNIVRIQPNSEDPERSSVEMSVETQSSNAPKESKPETLVVEASIKPYINVLWIGTFTILIGFIMTIIRRSREARIRQPLNQP